MKRFRNTFLAAAISRERRLRRRSAWRTSTSTPSHVLTNVFAKDVFKRGDSFYLAFDELIDYPGYESHEIKALHETLSSRPEIVCAVVGVDGRPDLGPPLRFYAPEEACPHRALFKIAFASAN